jgi:hypothetical protein
MGSETVCEEWEWGNGVEQACGHLANSEAVGQSINAHWGVATGMLGKTSTAPIENARHRLVYV